VTMTVGNLIKTLAGFDFDDEILINDGYGECPVGEVNDEGHGVVIYAEGLDMSGYPRKKES
jgi:hypothetical protein